MFAVDGSRFTSKGKYTDMRSIEEIVGRILGIFIYGYCILVIRSYMLEVSWFLEFCLYSKNFKIEDIRYEKRSHCALFLKIKSTDRVRCSH